MRERNTARFDFEAEKLVGAQWNRGVNWENRLFRVVTESVEITALQRGVDRWEPDGVAWLPAALQKPEPPAASAAESSVERLIIYNPPEGDRFVTCVPFYDLAAAVGDFGPEQPGHDSAEHPAWIRVRDHRITPGMFAIRVQGRSMEPKIPDGSCCLFRGGEALAGTRQGRIVLVALRDSVNPETGGRLTVKRYCSEKRFDEDGGFEHTLVRLEPLNPDYEPILIESAEEDALRVLGEFVGVVAEGKGG